VSCLEAKRPKAGLIENVPEFLNWALFPAWSDAINRLGYTISPHIVDSADHGVPQSRVRAYLILTRSQNPVRLRLPHRPHVPVSAIIDWETNGWTDWHTLCDRTVARLSRGQSEFGSRFVAPYYGHGWCRSIHRPIGTITTRDRWQIVDGDRARFLAVDECRKAMGFPSGYVLPTAKQSAKLMLGQAVCPPVITDILQALKAQI
jgi:DNA (cytosine-5)-methyltransferase 1